MTDPIWWFYLFWLPKFLYSEHGLSLNKIGPPLIVIYLVSDLGSIFGGWFSSFLIKRGISVNSARKSTMLICSLCVVPIFFASQTSSLWTAVALIAMATAAHQGWSANVFAMASDMFPKKSVASVVGIGGTAGAVGGIFISSLVGILLESTGSYIPVFIIASTSYLGALLLVHLLVPVIR